MAKEIVAIDNMEYQRWLQHLFEEIDRQRLKTVMQLNAATLQYHWWLGNDIIQYPDFPFLQVPLAKLQEMPILQVRLCKFHSVC